MLSFSFASAFSLSAFFDVLSQARERIKGSALSTGMRDRREKGRERERERRETKSSRRSLLRTRRGEKCRERGSAVTRDF
jgi:hypothetical protein